MPTSPHRQHNLATADNMSHFIEQLPRTLAAPAHLDLAPGDDPVQWQITVTLTPSDQATLDALEPSAYRLCAAAQHALGLAALGSQIDPAHHDESVSGGWAAAGLCWHGGALVGCEHAAGGAASAH